MRNCRRTKLHNFKLKNAKMNNKPLTVDTSMKLNHDKISKYLQFFMLPFQLNYSCNVNVYIVLLHILLPYHMNIMTETSNKMRSTRSQHIKPSTQVRCENCLRSCCILGIYFFYLLWEFKITKVIAKGSYIYLFLLKRTCIHFFPISW